MTPFRHPSLRAPLDPTGARELHTTLVGYLAALPGPEKRFTGIESPGHCTHAGREIGKARRR